MKILTEVFDEYNQLKDERILDIEDKDTPNQIRDLITLAVKRNWHKIIMHLHDR
jgi:hypothetical protein